MERCRDNEDGFTLVELLVVILIIGVLTAIAVPAFLNQRKEAYTAALRSDLHNTAIAVQTYIAANPGDKNIQPSEIYTYVGNRFSDGSDVLIFGGEDNWCLVGVNWNSTKSSYNPDALKKATNGLLYDSYHGGMQPVGTDIWSGECVTGFAKIVPAPDSDIQPTGNAALDRSIKSINHWLERKATIGAAATAEEARIAKLAGR